MLWPTLLWSALLCAPLLFKGGATNTAGLAPPASSVVLCGQQYEVTDKYVSISQACKHLPPQIERLSALTYLGVTSSTELETLPTQIGQLSALRVLEVVGTRATALPTQIARLSELILLNVASNRLSALATEVGLLDKLTSLHVGSNELLSLPTEIGQLQSLRALTLFSNQISLLPRETWELQALSSLDATSNLINRLPPELAKATILRVLKLGSNRLMQIPTDIALLPALYWLNLEFNRLTEVPSEIGNCESLLILHLGSNLLTELPTELGQLASRLGFLDVSGNDFVAIATQVWRLEKLNTLNVASNRFNVLPTQIGQLSSLGFLDISFNQLTALPSEIGLNTRLLNIDFSFNQVEALPKQIGNLTRVTSLLANWNHISVLPNEFDQLTALRVLDLSNNRLKELSPGFADLVALTSLSLETNEILDYSPLKRLTQLTTLTLGNVVCDCKLLRWYADFVQAASSLRNTFEAATCDGVNVYEGLYPHILRAESQAPCAHVEPRAPAHLISSREVEVRWTYPYFSTEVVTPNLTRLVTVDFAGLARNVSNKWGKPLADSTALSVFRTCQAIFFSGTLPQDVEDGVFGFEVNWRSSRESGGRRTCVFADEVFINETQEFAFRIAELMPATNLEVSVRPFLLNFTVLAQMTYIFGPRSQLLQVATQPDVPENSPKRLAVESAGDRRVELSWSEPPQLGRNGDIVAYQIEIESLSSGALRYIASTTRRSSINLNEHFLNEALTRESFRVRVRAKTRVGDFSQNWSNPLTVVSCPSFMQRDQSNNVDDCYAITGFYKRANGFAQSCTDLAQGLPPGAIYLSQCLAGRVTVEDLPVAIGFWRASLLSEDIRMCPNDFCTQRRSKLLNGTIEKRRSPDFYCAEHHIGTYCADCTNGYVLGSHGCAKCEEEYTNLSEAISTFACIFVGVWLSLNFYVLSKAGVLHHLFCRNWKRISNKPRSRWSDCSSRFWTKVRIFFGFVQVLSSYQRTYPRTVSSEMLGIMALVGNLDLTWIFANSAFRCLYDYNHYDVLLVATLMPITLSLCLIVSTKSTALYLRILTERVDRHCVSVILFLLFLVYPHVSQTILSTFWCEEFRDADTGANLTTSALMSDYRLSCAHEGGQNRKVFEAYAAIMVAVYPIGGVVLYCVLLHIYRDRVRAARSNSNSELIAKVAFLINPYKVEVFWFEAYELCRKLVQTSVVGFLASGQFREEIPQFVPLISLSLTIFFSLALALVRPYKFASDLAFGLVSLVLLMPVSMYRLADPYVRDGTEAQLMLETLIVTALAILAMFVVVDILAVFTRRKGQSSKVDTVTKL